MADPALDMTFTNRAAFDAAIKGLAAELSDLGAPINTVARSTVAAAAAAAPRKTGTMAGAHRAGPGWSGRSSAGITVGTVYAAPQHWGWRGHGIARKPWIVAFWRRDGAWPNKFSDDLQAIIDKQAAQT